jgi:hypothetical protein
MSPVTGAGGALPAGMQLISFAVESDSQLATPTRIGYMTQRGDTYAKIAAKLGRPDLAPTIAAMNKPPMNCNAPLGKVIVGWGHHYEARHLWLPGVMQKGDSVDVLADDPAPLVKNGYATYDIVLRPGRGAISRFLGYNPIALDVPVQFEAYAADGGTQVEADIAVLEKMAGIYPGGQRLGPPAVVRLSVTGSKGGPVPLVPFNYQWNAANVGAPLYRISNITWDASPLRSDSGRRIRQKAVVEMTEYTPVQTKVTSRSVSARAKVKKAKAK